MTKQGYEKKQIWWERGPGEPQEDMNTKQNIAMSAWWMRSITLILEQLEIYSRTLWFNIWTKTRPVTNLCRNFTRLIKWSAKAVVQFHTIAKTQLWSIKGVTTQWPYLKGVMTWAKVTLLVYRFWSLPWTNGPSTHFKWKFRYSPIQCAYLEPSTAYLSDRRRTRIDFEIGN